MRALVCNRYGPPDQLVVEDWESPVPGPGQVAVEVRAAGLNYPDLLAIAGKYQVRTEPPFVPGLEASGVISAVGDGVTRFKPGDKVVLTTESGAFAEICVVDEHRIMPLPDGLGFEQGAGFRIIYATSYHAFRQRAPIDQGQSVLVLGAGGGVGSTAVEIAKAMGAYVIAAASSSEKLDFAVELGADDTVNYSQRSLKESLRELTSGRGVNVVYDPVGGGMARQALSALASDGRYLVVGFASGDIPAFPANLILLRQARLIGVYWGDWAARYRLQDASNMREIAALVADGSLRPRVSAAYPVEQFAEAFSALAGRRVVGKVVLTF